MLYCKDFSKFGNKQKWIKRIKHLEISFEAKREVNDSWEVYFFIQRRKYSITFNSKHDYIPFIQNKNKDYKYWSFPEAKHEIESLAEKMYNCSPCSS